MSKSKKKPLTVLQEIKIFGEIDENKKSNRDIFKEHNIPKSTISTILKNNKN